jgi:RNA polymerase sigma-70 factor (family 1)
VAAADPCHIELIVLRENIVIYYFERHFNTMQGIDHTEFKKIFDSWYEPIRNFLYFKTGDMKSAEDIAQDVFLKVWEKKDGIKPATIRPYLYTLAGNMFLNRQMHQKVHLKFTVNYTSELYSESPEFQFEVKEFDHRLQMAINNLDDKKRTVFLMNRIEKLTYVQIAENLGITVKAVEKRMEKALSFLRKAIELNI